MKNLLSLYQSQKEKLNNFFGIKSKIISENDQIKVLEWLKEEYNEILYFNVVYTKGDNNDISYFHQKCDGIGPNLIICKSISQEIFGWFTPFDWKQNGEKYDKKAFIFSLTKNIKYRNKTTYKSNYICKEAGPDFHWDFVFNCGSMLKCRSFLLKDKDKHGINTGDSCYLVNEPLFGDGFSDTLIKEIEVFQVKKYKIVSLNE